MSATEDSVDATSDRLYFRQFLSGHDFAVDDPFAAQMVNFCYAIGDRHTGEAVLVDPAYRPGELVDLVDADGLDVVGVIGTHYHPDHLGGDIFGQHLQGVAELLERCDVPVHIQRDEAPWVERTTGVGSDQLALHDDRDIITIGETRIELLHTPGHTPGSQCVRVDGHFLGGDTLFIDGCGRTDLPGGDGATLMHTLHERLKEVPDEAVLFPGHKYAPQSSATMGHVRRHNFVFAAG